MLPSDESSFRLSEISEASNKEIWLDNLFDLEFSPMQFWDSKQFKEVRIEFEALVIIMVWLEGEEILV